MLIYCKHGVQVCICQLATVNNGIKKELNGKLCIDEQDLSPIVSQRPTRFCVYKLTPPLKSCWPLRCGWIWIWLFYCWPTWLSSWNYLYWSELVAKEFRALMFYGEERILQVQLDILSTLTGTSSVACGSFASLHSKWGSNICIFFSFGGHRSLLANGPQHMGCYSMIDCRFSLAGLQTCLDMQVCFFSAFWNGLLLLNMYWNPPNSWFSSGAQCMFPAHSFLNLQLIVQALTPVIS